MEIHVPDIHCDHCRITLEASLRELESIDQVSVDVARKIVAVKGAAESSLVIEAIRNAGYNPD